MNPYPFKSARVARVLGLAAALALAACNSDTPQSLVASGKQYAARHEFKSAAIQYKSALQLDPHSAETRLLLGQALLAAGDAEGAVLELTKALDDKAPAAAVLPSLSGALLQSGDYKKLVAAYGDLSLDDKPAQAALKSNVATAWGALGDKAKTEAAVAAALAAQPDFGPAVILEARMLAGQRRFDEASALVDQVLARNDKMHDAWLLKGEIVAVAKGDAKAAEASYRKALAIERGYAPAHMAIISSRIVQRDIAGAKAQADRLREVLPNHPLSVLVDAQLAYLDGRLPQAREHLQRLLRVFPDRPQILILAGAVEAGLGSPVQAETYFAKALQIAPGLDVARRNLAEADLRLGQYDKALETLRPMLQADPPNADALSLAGDAELRRGNAVAAESYFVRAAKLDPTNIRLQTAAALTRLWRADAASAFAELAALSERSKDTYADEAILAARLKRREYDAALATIDVMARKQPGQAAHADLRGRVYQARGDLVAARQAFEAALRRDPGLFAAVASLADIDLAENKLAQAVGRLEAAVKADPHNPFALLLLADLESRQGRPLDEIKKLLADAILAAPSAAEPRLQQIDFLMRKRQLKDALAAAREALTALPGDARVLDAAGIAQMQAGDVEQAVTTFRKLAAVKSDSAQPYLRLANLYAATGKREQAEAAVGKALEIEPALPAAQAAMVDLLVSGNRQRNALEFIDRIKQTRPGEPIGYLLEASYHLRRNDVDAAAAAFRAGIAKTGNSELAGDLYELLLRSDRKAEADRFGAGWMKQHPDDAAFEYHLASTHIVRNELALAEQGLRRVLAAYPNHALALNNMAWVLATLGKPGAVAYARRAVDLLPDRPALMDTLAMALAADRQFGPAVEMQRRAIELAPGDSGLRLNLARLALQAGDKTLARQELTHLQGLGPSFPEQAEVARLLQVL